MTSSPYGYKCKWCKEINLIMPCIENFRFECEFCGKVNQVIYIFSWWFTKRTNKEAQIRRIKNE